ncbi:MAG: prolyl oligopeptidase family serine peptidase [Rhodopirellula sp.]|nr:prolyl oligopeptidase family serine peptidase [Rhodopirellula sp.]
MNSLKPLVLTVAAFSLSAVSFADPPNPDTTRGDRMIAAYFEAETAGLAEQCLAGIDTREQWESARRQYRRQLLEMLGLEPLPERTDLKATITSRIDGGEYTVEKLHFQSRPGLYVTASLYLPRSRQGRVPAILYVCGHGASKKNGVSYGNKATYQHHGVWFARHGYACLMIDTLQMGEIEGIHHGTYNRGMWWWNNRGYTSAGVEAWNCMRALDYLQSREEVDPERLGVTGRSGGGAYSWWIAATDDRIKAAVPVAGITDLENHVVDGCVEGHCDCMFMVNTYRWDYPLVAAMVAPRPLLIGNSDADRIFPLDGVRRTYEKAKRIYELYDAGDKIALNITEGGHKDTPELRLPAFHWFDRYLMGADRQLEDSAEKPFAPEQLKVFAVLPEDQRNTEIQETFVPVASEPNVPASAEEWASMRANWRTALEEKVFRGWPREAAALDVREVFSVKHGGIAFRAVEFTSQSPIRLRLYLVEPVAPAKSARVVLRVLDQEEWNDWLAAMQVTFAAELKDECLPEKKDEAAFAGVVQSVVEGEQTLAFVAPRGIGPTLWNQTERKLTHIRRRFMLLGQTLDGMRVWDVRRAVQALRSLDGIDAAPLVLKARGATGGMVLYASLFEPEIAAIELIQLSGSHRDGPILLNIRRYIDIPTAVALAAERSLVSVDDSDDEVTAYARAVAGKLEWKGPRGIRGQ